MRSAEMRRWRIQSAVGGAAAAVGQAGRVSRIVRPPRRPALSLPVHTRASGTAANIVHLTIDDGPSPNTPALLRILRQQRAKADFFLIGEAVRAYPDLPAQITAAGHAIHNHSLSHRLLDVLSPGDIAGELEQAARLIHPAARSARSYVRLPCGAGADDPYVHDAVRRWRPGSELVQWSVDTFDHKAWDRCRTPEDVDREAVEAADSALREPDLAGSIILMHDSSYGDRLPLVDRFSQVLLDRLLTGLARRGLVTRLLGEKEE
jgi:peptidoglycan/xylan/chitin deacetylase (PgdA/CDA1 family)